VTYGVRYARHGGRIWGRNSKRPMRRSNVTWRRLPFWSAAVLLTGLADSWDQAGTPGQLPGRRETVEVADLGRDRERPHPPDLANRGYTARIGDRRR
jgi:hypothetical protein